MKCAICGEGTQWANIALHWCVACPNQSVFKTEGMRPKQIGGTWPSMPGVRAETVCVVTSLQVNPSYRATVCDYFDAAMQVPHPFNSISAHDLCHPHQRLLYLVDHTCLTCCQM